MATMSAQPDDRNMVYQAGDYEAVHHQPIWRERANFIFAAYLGVKNGNNEWEQLWGQATESDKFVICCIPFFVRDLALGDVVEIDSNSILKNVVKRSGQVTFRVWIMSSDSVIRQEIKTKLDSMKLLMERSSENLVALSAPDNIEAQIASNYLRNCEELGLLQYETGSTV